MRKIALQQIARVQAEGLAPSVKRSVVFNYRADGSELGQKPVITVTEAEQNRLIVANMSLVEPIASTFRGKKGIPFDELVAAGKEGLVKAARNWDPKKGRTFTSWAYLRIEGAIQHLIRDWEPLENSLVSEETDFEYEWRWAAPDFWEAIACSPEDLLINREQITNDRVAFESALIGLGRKDRRILGAYACGQSLASIGREFHVSYQSIQKRIQRLIRKMRRIMGLQPYKFHPAPKPKLDSLGLQTYSKPLKAKHRRVWGELIDEIAAENNRQESSKVR